MGEWEDVLQEAYLAVLDALPDYDPAKGSPEAFIYGIVRMKLRTCCTSGGLIRVPKHALSRKRQESNPALYERAKRLFSGGWQSLGKHDDARTLEPGHRLDLAELREALAELPAEAVALLWRRHGDRSETLREMAATDGCSHEAIRQRAVRARAACRPGLEDFEDM